MSIPVSSFSCGCFLLLIGLLWMSWFVSFLVVDELFVFCLIVDEFICFILF